jgi:hypothetical protein
MGFVQITAQTLALEVKDGKLTYKQDHKGNQVLDYSYCGYMSSEQDIPDVENAVFVAWQSGDNTERIQRAIDYVSSLPLNKDGLRGAVLLDKGVFLLNKGLRINASGVVLRGIDRDKTILQRQGTDRETLLTVEGEPNLTIRDSLTLVSGYVPVNSRELEVSSGNRLKAGDRVMIMRPSVKEWINALKCNEFGGGISALGWKPGDMDMYWDRTVTQVTGNRILIDAPLTVAIDAQYGGAKILPYQWKGRIAHTGIENLTLISGYDKQYPKDEEHCWTGISMENIENCWIRRINFKHFSGSAVILQQTASRITVEDCISRQPISEIGGLRRCTFYTLGQQTLFQRCYSEYGIHDFAAGYCAAGPNAFVQCESKESLGFSGSIDSWACGLLFDIVNIDGHNLSCKNLGQDKSGAGWNTANSFFWQCTAAEIECYSPADDAKNRAYGCWAQFSGDGEWAESNNHVQPRSLFYAQLRERLGKDCPLRSRILPMNTNASSSPTVEVAMQLAKEAYIPKLTLEHWIEQGVFSAPVSPDNINTIERIKFNAAKQVSPVNNVFEITNGRLLMNGALLAGNKHDVPWWSGKLRNTFLSSAKPHITRFVPGRTGIGLTDCIDSVIGYMTQKNILALDHNYGLWYDRRRDDHERIRRRDGDVWAPFYELPFARSSQGTAWDGLSKYDLNRPNTWYWMRLKQFARKGAEKGLLLFHENYFQHNIIEAGAHWVDSPWRTANNINNTGFAEPVHFAGDKRVFVADMFYDVSHPVRRELHRSYIRQCLEQLADCPNVIHLISAEYTGPLDFVRFWLDVIAEWKAETGKPVKIALSATKDVQDAILDDSKRASVVDIIDIRYWHYKSDGTVYAPEGGKNLAPRQHARKMDIGRVTFDNVYHAVSEYRRKFPQKAVTYYAQGYSVSAWAVLMAGGSCPALSIGDNNFLIDVAQMKPQETGDSPYRIMEKSGIGVIIYSQSETDIPLTLASGYYCVKRINPHTGDIKLIDNKLKINQLYHLKVPSGGGSIYWFHKL